MNYLCHNSQAHHIDTLSDNPFVRISLSARKLNSHFMNCQLREPSTCALSRGEKQYTWAWITESYATWQIERWKFLSSTFRSTRGRHECRTEFRSARSWQCQRWKLIHSCNNDARNPTILDNNINLLDIRQQPLSRLECWIIYASVDLPSSGSRNIALGQLAGSALKIISQ